MKITLVTSSIGDWVGMYFEDTLIEQGHGLRDYEILEHVRMSGQVVSSVDRFDAEDWLLDEGSLPDTLTEVKAKDKKWKKKNKAR